jgi:hypothetical protein
MLKVMAMAAAFVLCFSFAAFDANAKKKGGQYIGGSGSSHKGGTYVSPPGQRYSKNKQK